MSVCKASQSINLPQLQNLIKRDPESYRDEVCTFPCFMFMKRSHRSRGVIPQFRVARFPWTSWPKFWR